MSEVRGPGVLCANCLDPALGMPAVPDRAIDVVITDPPYSPKVHRCSRRGLTDYKERKGDAARAARTRDLAFEPLTPKLRAGAAQQFARLARRWVLVFSDLEGVDAWRQDLEWAGLEYVRCGIWVKLGCTPQLTGDRPGNGCEAIVIAHQTSSRGKPIRKRWNGGGLPATWSHPIVLDRGHNGARVHTTQKPLGLMRDLVELFSDPGELVADAFTGSGTTGIACRLLGRRFLGFEMDAACARLAQRRIDGERGIELAQQLELPVSLR